ncbi:flagellin N-terminal helical domain-containing protein [Paenibacillus planticolens]|uniref:Flagellin n=1 Tax=Paenibacillus planticolens TaxID=2654976 RepID=A0ABX1ZHA5_9BACL|nr:flagellin [Paenibacillus planticolens]NOU99473.1 flagellar protein [Paenibacillus planticolens]
MRINHNIAAQNTHRQLAGNTAAAGKSLEKLSSGLRINRAGDDAAGLAISEKMRAQIRGLDQAQRNAQDSISLIQTAEGALTETHSILQRMKELATQAANDTNTADDRGEIQKEINQLTAEINRIGNTTEFNTKKLLNGDISEKSGVVTIDKTTNPFNAGTTTISNPDLDKNSSLKAGNYTIDVIDTVTKSATHTADNAIKDVSVGANSTLNSGDYEIRIGQTQTKNASLDTPAGSVTGVSIAPTSTLANGAHEVTITRTDSVATGAFTGANTGLTADGITVTGNNPVSGSFDVKTVGVLGAVNNGTVGPGAAGALTLSLDNPSALSNGVGYQLAYADEGNGIFSVQLMDTDGTTALTDKVILDNNVQNYQFKALGSTNDFGVSFKTATGVNTTLTGANAGGNHQTFDVSSTVTLSKGGSTVGTTSIAAGAAAGSVTIGDFTIAHGVGNTIKNGTDSFTVTNDLAASFDGGPAVTFTAGSTVTFANGVSIDTRADSTTYSASNTYDLTVGTATAYTATVHDANGGVVVGTQTLTDGSTYNLGNGVDLTIGTLTGPTTHAFSVTAATTKTAKLTNTTTGDTTTKSDIAANSTIDFGNGLKVNMGAKTNGQAAFTVEGGVEDRSLSMQVGANQGQSLSMNVADMRASALGITSSDASAVIKDTSGNVITGAAWTTTKQSNNGTDNVNVEYSLDVSDATKASAAIKVLDNSINAVSAERSKLGAYQNRLEHTINNLGAASENLTAAESRIRDVDMAKEMMEFTKNNILSQAAQAMLAQANQQPQGVLQLLR